MNVLLIGSGGREHAIAWKLKQSNQLDELFISPGNAGTASLGKNVSLDLGNIEALEKFIDFNKIEMVIVGPEQPLVDGLKDQFLSSEKLKEINFIGPDKRGAMLEGSKDFSKTFMKKYGIPTAAYRTFDKENFSEASNFLKTLKPPYVLKADGVAAGKGVLIVNTLAEAEMMLEKMILDEKFGEASKKVVIEEFLDGIELSVFVLTDGVNYVILPEAKDYKRIGEKDTGLNTGGMGSISPVPFADKAFMEKVAKQIIKPTIQGLINEKIDYTGFIFFGLIKVVDEPFVIEYNVRMGDPETESVFPRIKSDVLELFNALKTKSLDQVKLEFDPRSVAAVFAVSGGYPEAYEKNKLISGLDQVNDCMLFHAGTRLGSNKEVLTNGGRVIAISGFGKDMQDALNISYQNIEKINFEGMYYRKDLGFDL